MSIHIKNPKNLLSLISSFSSHVLKTINNPQICLLHGYITALPDPSRLGFFLLSEEALIQVIIESEQNPNFCVLDSHYIQSLFTFKELNPPQSNSYNNSFLVTVPNEYSLFFTNCVPQYQVNMDDYLPAGQTKLPMMYFVFSLAYFVFLVFWIYICITNKHSFIRVTLLFTVIVLIGTGWSFLNIFTREREEANLASVVIGETSPFIKDWVTWNQVFLSLKETSKMDGKAAKNLAKLALFRQFYIVVIGYLFSAYKYQWVSTAAEETVSLAFYMVMFYMFRPVEKNEYFVLDEEEEEAAQQIPQDEEFEL
ncbi:hypothetical protein MKX01_024970 [Papaver californicum]|nr:hypothetical protein MKX01_024970 [Papaver californicum]